MIFINPGNAQIEKGMLAFTVGLEKVHHYTLRRDTYIITNYKPLESIMLKPLCKQGWGIRNR